MKRILFLATLLIAVVSSVSAQKGQSAVGINLGAAPCLESGVSLTNFEIGAKYQYGITDAIRLEADLSYGLKSKGIDVFEVSANAHYLFNIGEKIKVYPLVGIGYGHIGGGFSNNDIEYDYTPSTDDQEYDFYSRAYVDKDGNVVTGNKGEEPGKNDDGNSTSANKFLFNVGAGAEYALSSKLSVGLELKYQYMSHFSRLPITVGVTYQF